MIELFRAHHPELVRLAVLIVGDPATAEDVVLPARQREVLALRYYVDMSVAGAAATPRISESACRASTSRPALAPAVEWAGSGGTFVPTAGPGL